MSGTFPNSGYAPWIIRGLDGIFVSQTGILVNIGLGSEEAAAQPNWFVDEVNGDDSNSGLTAGQAFQTFDEIRRRVGPRTVNQPTRIHVLSDLTAANGNPLVYVDFRLGPNGSLTIVGEKPTTVLFTGTFTAVSPTVQATNTQLSVTDASIPVSWTASNLLNTTTLHRRIRITASGDPSHVGGVSYPVREIAPKEARTNDFKVPYSSLPASLSFFFTPNVGDAYVVETDAATIECLVINAVGSCMSTQFSPQILFTNIELNRADDAWHPMTMVANSINVQPTPAPIMFSGCNVAHGGPVNDTQVAFDASKIGESESGFVFAQYNLGFVAINSSLVVGALTISGEHASWIGGRTLFEQGGGFSSGLFVQDGFVLMNQVGLFADPGGFGIGIAVDSVSTVRARPASDPPETVYGADHQEGVHVFSGSSFIWENIKPTITGVVEVNVGGMVDTWAGFGDNKTNLLNLSTISKRA